MALVKYRLVNNVYYNQTTGNVETPSGLLNYKNWSYFDKVDINPATLHKLIVNTNGIPTTKYAYNRFEDTAKTSAIETYFDIVPGTTYPAVCGVDDHGFNNSYFVKIDGTWYEYTDPNYDFNPAFNVTPEQVSSASTISRLEEIYAEYGETWTDCVCTLKSGYIVKEYPTNVVSQYSLTIISGWSDNDTSAVLTNKNDIFITSSRFHIYDTRFNNSVIFPTSDQPLEPYHFYKYNNKLYNINGEEVTGFNEVSSVNTGRQICVNNVQAPVYKTNIEGQTEYYYYASLIGAPQSSTFTHTEGPYKCLYINLNNPGSSNHLVFYDDNNDTWYRFYITPTGDIYKNVLDSTDEAYLKTLDLSQITDTVEIGTINYPILSYSGSMTSAYSDLGTVSGSVSTGRWNTRTSQLTYYPLYITEVEIPVKVERPFVSEYTKTQGNLQRNNQPVIKVYNTLALANADISNIAANEVVIVKGGNDKSMYRKVNGALTKLFNYTAPPSLYNVGDIIFVYDRSLVDSNWLLCDGSSFNQSDYPTLYTLLGSTTLPNITDKCIKGCAAANIGTYFSGDIPAHTHDSFLGSSLSHTHATYSAKSHTHTNGVTFTPRAQSGATNISSPLRTASGASTYSTATVTADTSTYDMPLATSTGYNVLHINEASVWVYIKAR